MCSSDLANLSKVMNDFVGEQRAINSQLHQKIENVESSLNKRIDGMQNDLYQKIDNIQYSISRLTNLNTVNEKGKFPSQPSQNPKGGMYMLSEDMDMKAKVATMARRLEELELKKMHEVQAISKTQAHVMPAPFANHVIMW